MSAAGLAGIVALRFGDAQAARRSFEQQIAGGAQDSATLLGLAMACDKLDDWQTACDALDKALARDPYNLRALLLRGDILDRKGDSRSAVSFYDTALKAAGRGGTLPADVIDGLTRAQNALKRYEAAYEAHLRSAMADRLNADGLDRFGLSLDLMLGKKKIYLQAPQFYYFPGLPQLQFYPREQFEWLAQVEAATDDIRAELLTVLEEDGAFVPYVEGDPNRPFNAQRGLRDNPNWSAFYFWKSGMLQEKNAARCPKTMAVLSQLPMPQIETRTPTALFSLLRGKTRIPAHHGFVNTRLICHLPLIVPEGCGFRVGNDVRAWHEGKAWVFDDTIEHEAWNNSDQTRVILLFDIWRPELSEDERHAVRALFTAIDAYGGKSSPWLA